MEKVILVLTLHGQPECSALKGAQSLIKPNGIIVELRRYPKLKKYRMQSQLKGWKAGPSMGVTTTDIYQY